MVIEVCEIIINIITLKFYFNNFFQCALHTFFLTHKLTIRRPTDNPETKGYVLYFCKIPRYKGTGVIINLEDTMLLGIPIHVLVETSRFFGGFSRAIVLDYSLNFMKLYVILK